MWCFKDIFRPRQEFRIKHYFESKSWFTLIRYILIGYHEPFDLIFVPPIKDMGQLPDLTDSLLYTSEAVKHKKRIEKLIDMGIVDKEKARVIEPDLQPMTGDTTNLFYMDFVCDKKTLKDYKPEDFKDL